MKKRLILCTFALISSLFSTRLTKTVNASVNLDPIDGIYYQETFEDASEVPSDLTLISGKTNLSVEDGKLHFSYDSSGYSFLALPLSLSSLENYTIDIRYAFGAQASDSGRFAAIGYRANINDSKSLKEFYLMNFRRDGRTANGARNAGGTFTADGGVNNVGAPEINKYYNIKIVVDGETAKHYHENVLVQTVNLKTDANYKKILGENGYRTTGAIFIATMKTEFYVDEITVRQNENVVSRDYMMDTYQQKTNLTRTPSVYSYISNSESYTTLKSLAENKKMRPTGVILDFNDNLSVLAKNGDILGTLDSTIASFNKAIIPMLMAKNTTQAQKIAEYAKTANLVDAFYVSDQMELIQQMKTTYAKLSSLYVLPTDFVDNKTNIKNLMENANQASVRAILVPSTLKEESITYLQNHMITVFTIGETTDDIVEGVLHGATGIYTGDVNLAYTTFNSFKKGTLTRKPNVIGHRGMLSSSTIENTLPAFKEAYEKGANALEMDLHITSDKKIVVNHDDSVNGKKISSMTLSEIQQIDFVKGKNVYHLSSLEEVFDFFHDKDVMLALEIKINNQELVTLLKELFVKYQNTDIQEKCFFIGFYDKISMFKKVRELLPTMSIEVFPSTGVTVQSAMNLATQVNAAINPDKNIIPDNFVQDMQDRGYMINTYTYNGSQEEYIEHYINGYFGLTTDYPNWSMNFISEIMEQTLVLPVGEENAAYIPLKVKTRKGEVKTVYSFETTDPNIVCLEDGRMYMKEEETINCRIIYRFNIDNQYGYYIYSSSLQVTGMSTTIQDPFNR